ncbi:MAG: ATP-dependent helicase [Actinomycetales bacterium]
MTHSPQHLAGLLGLPEPTPQQCAVIEAAPDRPHVIIAGAGSGKTETMAARVVWLVANGHVLPEEILGLTFTRKAAAELSERVIRRLRGLRATGLLTSDDLGASPTIATYHSFAASLVTDHGLRVGVEPGTRLLGEAASWQLAYDLVERWQAGTPGPGRPGLPGEVADALAGDDLRTLDRAVSTIVQAVVSLSGQCAEHLVDPEQLGAELARIQDRITRLPRKGRHGAPEEPLPSKPVGKALAAVRSRHVLVPVLSAYARRKRELEAMDFGDQVAVAAELASLPDLAGAQRATYRVILLDEFQDTSHAQLELLARLFGGGHPVTAVGDPHQSIYGWRGASADNLDAFRARFGRRRMPVQTHHLTTSWRNPRSVLAAANVISAPLHERTPVPVPELDAAPTAEQGQVIASWHETYLDEATWVAEFLADRWQPGESTAAVICRQRSQFPAIAAALQERGLPVEVVGLGGLLQRPEVADVVATLQVLSDPTRSDALMRLLTGPRWQLGPRDLRAFGLWARHLAGESLPEPVAGSPDPDNLDQVGLVDALERLPDPDWVGPGGLTLSATARARLARLAGELARLRRRTRLPLVDLVMAVERSLLLEVELTLAAIQAGLVGSGRSQLDEFLDVAAGFSDGSGRPTLAAFVAWLEAAAERERGLTQADDDAEPRIRNGDGDRVDPSTTVVQVLTVHAAKGLEWDLVAIPGLVEGRFPSGRRKQGRDTASGWPTTLEDLPYPLRGDAAALPSWDLATPANHDDLEETLEDFRAACGDHEAAEERRLAYVAVTRARHQVATSGFAWDADRSRPKEPSRFLRELVVLAQAGEAGVVLDLRADLDDPAESTNPLQRNPVRHAWPLPSAHQEDLREAADAVFAATTPGSTSPEPGIPAELSREVDRLLAERSRARAPEREVALPGHLSASSAVALARDPVAFALDVRRPMPTEPRAATRRGTEFHEWIERRLRSQALLDLVDLPGAGDADGPDDADLEALKLAFESSVWARRQVLETEVDLETVVAGVALRGRIDAIFAAPAGDAPVRYDIVDWKTGPRPRGAAAEAARIQLAVYRVALARLRGLPETAVRASFCYLATGETVTPADGLDEAALTSLLVD